MRGFSLLKNMVFDWDGALFRIDRVSPNDEVLLERLDDGDTGIDHGRQLAGKDDQVLKGDLAAAGFALFADFFLNGHHEHVAVEQRSDGGLFGGGFE